MQTTVLYVCKHPGFCCCLCISLTFLIVQGFGNVHVVHAHLIQRVTHSLLQLLFLVRTFQLHLLAIPVAVNTGDGDGGREEKACLAIMNIFQHERFSPISTASQALFSLTFSANWSQDRCKDLDILLPPLESQGK